MSKTTAALVSKDLIARANTLPTTSAKIRWLASQGVSRMDISLILEKRYQHVRNVLEQKFNGKVEEPKVSNTDADIYADLREMDE